MLVTPPANLSIAVWKISLNRLRPPRNLDLDKWKRLDGYFSSSLFVCQFFFYISWKTWEMGTCFIKQNFKPVYVLFLVFFSCVAGIYCMQYNSAVFRCSGGLDWRCDLFYMECLQSVLCLAVTYCIFLSEKLIFWRQITKFNYFLA